MAIEYYISAYVHIDEVAHLYNLPIRHDQNIALWKMNGKKLYLQHYWELERLTGIKKHSFSFYNTAHFDKFLNTILSEYNLSIKDISDIWGIPQYGSGQLLAKVKGVSYHSSAHVYSLLFSNIEMFNNENIIIMAVDGGPDNLFDVKGDIQFAACYSEKGSIKKWISISSPGPLWSICKNIFGLEEGTLMALASGCRCEGKNFKDIEPEQLKCYKDAMLYDYRLREVFRKISDLDFSDIENCNKYNYDIRFSEEENKISMFMKLVQKLSIKLMEINITVILNKINIRCENTYLGITGGFALNCPTNSYLVSKFKFKGLYEIPCVSDTGISLGYGLGEIWARNKDIKFQFHNSYYGNVFNNNQINMGKIVKLEQPANEKQFVQDLCSLPVIWIEGRSEIGPRALGHRSILADPRKQNSKELLNVIKKREWWRPVAPIILEEELQNWFTDACPSKYMLQTYKINYEKRGMVPAIVHLDGSARIQTICCDENPLLYKYIKNFYIQTGVPIICNTSLNGRGQPIIDCMIDALKFAFNNSLSIMYLNGIRYELYLKDSNLKNYKKDNLFFDFICNLDYQEKKRHFNPYSLNQDEIFMLYQLGGCSEDLMNERNVKAIKRISKIQSMKLWG